MTLTTLPATATPEEVASTLPADGALILKDVIGTDVVDQLNAEVRPFIDNTPPGHDDFLGKTTKRTGALAARSATCRELILDELIVASAREFLGPYTRKIILHLTQTIEIGPGGAAQWSASNAK